MSDIIIDRDRLVVLREHLENIEPDHEGISHDEWVFAMQNVANMLGPANAVISLCPSCKNHDVCWFGGTDVILCRHYVISEPGGLGEPEFTIADSCATQRDLANAVGELSARITAHEKRCH